MPSLGVLLACSGRGEELAAAAAVGCSRWVGSARMGVHRCGASVSWGLVWCNCRGGVGMRVCGFLCVYVYVSMRLGITKMPCARAES